MNRDEALKRIQRMMTYKGNAQNTLKMYQYFLNALFDFFDADDVSLISPDVCIDYIIKLKEEGHYAHSTLNIMIASFRYFFEVVLDAPLTQRQLPSLNLSVKYPVVFSQDQLVSLFHNANFKMKAMMVLGFDCGLRVSEVAKLKCCDIDSTQMLLYVKDSKRGKSRTVKLSTFALETLRLYWKEYQPGSLYLFPSTRPCGYINQSSINNSFRLLLRKQNLINMDFRFHSLRHTYATLMLKHGCDPFFIT